jgi:DUF1009 family protein
MMSTPLGIIAGSGSLPIELARAARAAGRTVVAVAHIDESDPRLTENVNSACWVAFGQLKKTIKFLKSAGVTEIVLAGGISRKRLFSRGFRPDLKALWLLAKLKNAKDDHVLRMIAVEIEHATGAKVVSAASILKDAVPVAGPLTHTVMKAEHLSDALIGWQAAKKLGELDIAQTVVVARGAIVAVEALEGTDATIQRASELSGAGAVVVKVSKPVQDLRLDLPTIGLGTVRSLEAAKAGALVVEEGRCLILDLSEVVARADAAGIAIHVFRNATEIEELLKRSAPLGNIAKRYK